jgi:hypothetical protein
MSSTIDKKGQLTLDDFSGPDGFEKYLEYLEEDREADLLREIAIQIAKEKGTVTADDLRNFVEENNIPISKDYRVFGAVLVSLKRKGVLKIVGYTKTEVPTSHGRPIAMYALDE